MTRKRLQPDHEPLSVQILGLSRYLRIALILIFALVTTMLVSPLIDRIYLENFYDPSTTVLPAMLTVGCGVIVYIVGWMLLIGFGDTLPIPGNWVILYSLYGIVVCMVVLTLLVNGAVIGSQQ